jgi:hypothetical protein
MLIKSLPLFPGAFRIHVDSDCIPAFVSSKSRFNSRKRQLVRHPEWVELKFGLQYQMCSIASFGTGWIWRVTLGVARLPTHFRLTACSHRRIRTISAPDGSTPRCQMIFSHGRSRRALRSGPLPPASFRKSLADRHLDLRTAEWNFRDKVMRRVFHGNSLSDLETCSSHHSERTICCWAGVAETSYCGISATAFDPCRLKSEDALPLGDGSHSRGIDLTGTPPSSALWPVSPKSNDDMWHSRAPWCAQKTAVQFLASV